MAAILVSHVHDDAGHAARLGEELARHHDAVFLDVADIPSTVGAPGTAGRVGGLDAMVAVIGLSWLDEVRRNRDLVAELDAAMRRGIPLVPVLVDGAVMPRDEDLPPELRNLVARPAVAIGGGAGPERVAAELTRLGVGGRRAPRSAAAATAPTRAQGSRVVLAIAVAILLAIGGLVFALLASTEVGSVDTRGWAQLLL